MDNNNDSWVVESERKETDSTKTLFLQKVNFGLDLDVLEEELKHFSRRFIITNFDFIDIHDKCYDIYNNRYYTNKYTLYEYCIISKKFP